MTNVDPDKNQLVPVGCMVYNEEDDILYTGDEMGNILAYDFTQLMKDLLINDLPTKSREGQYSHRKILILDEEK